MAAMPVGPNDVHARAAGDVHLDARRLLARINRYGHQRGSPSITYPWRLRTIASSFRFQVAAIARRNRVAVRTRRRMPQKRADALVKLRTDDVLEFAGLVVRFRVVNLKRVFEQPLRQPITTHYVARAPAPRQRE